MQVSPVEIENVLLAHPDKLIIDATVAGVKGGRTSDELVPRAWVVLSDTGRKYGERRAVKMLEAHVRSNLSRYKWLRGGIQVTAEVSFFDVHRNASLY
jgi:acyl-CoA synthetase (AMP-forming)/AMP-acid ligase II